MRLVSQRARSRYPAPMLWIIGLCHAPAIGQIPINHAVVATRHAAAPATKIVAVDLANSSVRPVGRFTGDGFSPLAIRHDPVDRDLVIALQTGSTSRALRLQLDGLTITSQQQLAEVPGTITDLAFADGGEVFLLTGGSSGALYGVRRNGSVPRRVAAVPRGASLFSQNTPSWHLFVLQSGRTTAPALAPALSTIDLRTGQQVPRIDMQGYRPLELTGFGMQPTAIGTAIVTAADGSIGISIGSRAFSNISITPRLPAGSAVAIRLQDTFFPIVLGGAANPRLKTFEPAARAPTWRFLSGNLPGDPVDFDLTSRRVQHTVSFGRRCQPTGMLIGATSGGAPRLGNTRFEFTVIGALPNSTTTLALGLSNRLLAGAPLLPLDLPGGCLLWVSVEATVGVATNQNGFGQLPVPIPNLPQLLDMNLFAQFGQPVGGTLNTTDAVALHLHR